MDSGLALRAPRNDGLFDALAGPDPAQIIRLAELRVIDAELRQPFGIGEILGASLSVMMVLRLRCGAVAR
jgi:hypothetical protein